MKSGMGSIPICSEFWSGVVVGDDFKEVTKFIFAFQMYGVS